MSVYKTQMNMAANENRQPDDGSSELAADRALSLDQLSQAYADVLQQEETPSSDAPSASEAAELESEDGSVDPAGIATDDPIEISPQSLLEAILFVGTADSRPLSSKEIAGNIRGVSPREVDELVVSLNAAYAAEHRPYSIVSDGAGYALALRDEFSNVRDRFYGRIKEARLSQVAIDILAIVAYNQALTRKEVEQLRDKPSGGILSQLVRRQLLRIERDEQKPRVAHYFTTQRFLNLFNLHSLDDLPQSLEDRML